MYIYSSVEWLHRIYRTIFHISLTARSTTEAKYRSLDTAIMEIQWLQSLLKELRIFPHPSHFSSVSTWALFCCLRILCFTIEQSILSWFTLTSGLLTVAFIPSLHQIADVFTKYLSYPCFDLLWSKLRVSASTWLQGHIGQVVHYVSVVLYVSVIKFRGWTCLALTLCLQGRIGWIS